MVCPQRDSCAEYASMTQNVTLRKAYANKIENICGTDGFGPDGTVCVHKAFPATK